MEQIEISDVNFSYDEVIIQCDELGVTEEMRLNGGKIDSKLLHKGLKN